MVKAHLLATDRSLSVLVEATSRRVVRVAYTPYGILNNAGSLQSHLGFNGEFREGPGWYHLGNGHRVYNPVLRRFHSPDRLSPFGKGGLNPYAYCLGDPVNYSDPTGRVPKALQIITLVAAVAGLLVGMKALLAPYIQAQAAKSVASTVAAPASWVGRSKHAFLKHAHAYFAKKPGMAGARPGGIDLAGTIAGLANSPVAIPLTVLSMQEEPHPAIKPLMYISMAFSMGPLVSRTLTTVVPKLPNSAAGKRLAVAVHGRRKINSAAADRARETAMPTGQELVEPAWSVGPDEFEMTFLAIRETSV